MKSAFGSKRKARKIRVDDDEEANGGQESLTSPVAVESPIISNIKQKAFRSSSLRKSINFDDTEDGDDATDGAPQISANKPSIGRSSSMKKKKGSSSRLSFGPGEIISGDAAEALEDDEAFTPKKATLGRRIIESNAVRTLPGQRISLRDDDEERPTYSKDYLNELKNSTPSTPKDVQLFGTTVDDDEGLDASELDGATIVELEKDAEAVAYIPSEAEIREKKERRSRMAHEKDFISLNDTTSDGRGFDQQLSLLPRKKKPESRLVREDEDLGEGFDEFVEDGRISLGKKQEREAKRRQRKEMADMIHQAEGSSEGESDDSEAEVLAAYEAAQTRKGMEGLVKPEEKEKAASAQVPSKITPLPALSECLERLQTTLRTMEAELAKRQKKMSDLEQEKLDIAKREVEVQEALDLAGQKNDAQGNAGNFTTEILEAKNGGGRSGSETITDRGLESFGNTPTTRPEVVDLG